MLNNLQEQETILKQCVEKLENVQASRAALILLLKDALHEQVSCLNLYALLFFVTCLVICSHRKIDMHVRNRGWSLLALTYK